MKSLEEQLFGRIERVLQDHEEPYEPGAWEAFDKKRAGRRSWVPLFRIVGRAACVFFMVLTTNRLPMDGLSKRQHVVEPIVLEKQPDNVQATNGAGHSEASSAHRHLMKALAADVAVPMPIQRATRLTDRLPIHTGQVIPPDSTTYDDPDFYAGQEQAQKENLPAREAGRRNFDYSLVFSPAMSSRRFNFEAGVEILYSLGDNVLLKSGVKYTLLQGWKSDDRPLEGRRRAQGISLSASGIEVPIAFEWQNRAGIYLSGGISGVRLLNHELDNHFIEDRLRVITTVDGQGNTQQVVTTEEVKVVESRMEKVNNVIGFYTFSFGVRKMFGNNRLAIGPFVKVPLSHLSEERINLIQGGLHVRIGF